MNTEDRKRLQHVLEAAAEVLDILAQGRRSRVEELALIKLIEIIGEAARRVSEPVKARHPQVPWAQIIGMRHALIHEYFRIDGGKVWQVAEEHIPALKAQLLEILAAHE